MKLIALTKIESAIANWFVNTSCIVSVEFTEGDEYTWICMSNGDKFAVKELAYDIIDAMTAKILSVE